MVDYINNKKFEELIIEYKLDPKAHEEELFFMFEILIVSIFEGFNFKIDKDDAKQECFLLIIKRLPKWESNRGSAFNFFTTVIVNHLRHLFSRNKKYMEKLTIYKELKTKDPM